MMRNKVIVHLLMPPVARSRADVFVPSSVWAIELLYALQHPTFTLGWTVPALGWANFAFNFSLDQLPPLGEIIGVSFVIGLLAIQ